MKNYEEKVEMNEVETVQETTKKKGLSTRVKVGLGIAGGVIGGAILHALLSGGKNNGYESEDDVELSESDYEVRD